jgi:hypothetical protein
MASRMGHYSLFLVQYRSSNILARFDRSVSGEEFIIDKLHMNSHLRLIAALKVTISVAIIGCTAIDSCAQEVANRFPAKLKTEHLSNCIQVSEGVFSGAVPDGERAFAELQKLGIKTVISVDGMKPNVELAATFGLKYVHLPHGYDGIASQRLMEISKALLELPKPVYVHCHHGKHRSPAATAAACIMLNWIDRDSGLKVLSVAGTNPNFRGLVQAVEECKTIDPNALNRLSIDFKPVSEIAPLTEQMVVMDQLFEKIGNGIDRFLGLDVKQTDNSTKHDNVSSNQAQLADTALLLSESYIELSRTSQETKTEYLQLLEHGRDLSVRLETALRRTPSQAKQSWTQLKDNCNRCHQKFRDNASATTSRQ